jgi:hypothetical protein
MIEQIPSLDNVGFSFKYKYSVNVPDTASYIRG